MTWNAVTRLLAQRTGLMAGHVARMEEGKSAVPEQIFFCSVRLLASRQIPSCTSRYIPKTAIVESPRSRVPSIILDGKGRSGDQGLQERAVMLEKKNKWTFSCSPSGSGDGCSAADTRSVRKVSDLFFFCENLVDFNDARLNLHTHA